MKIMTLPDFTACFGVDFSGAKLAGRNAWVARCEPNSNSRLALRSLDRLEDLAGTAERGPALARLVTLVCQSSAALWGMDFPFGLPVELFPKGHRWPKVFDFVGRFGDDAYECGLACVRRVRRMRAAERKTRLHLRRLTDAEAKAPFDTFHYRLIYQTFFGLRDVIDPLRQSRGTAVLPFQYHKLPTAERVVVECCPSSVLKRLGLPHQNYKQPAGGPLTRVRKVVRHRLLDWLAEFVDIPDRFRRVVMRNPGGDALDAVIAAVGAARAVPAADHAAIAAHPRYRREGRMYV